MSAIWNKDTQQYEVFDTQVMDMVPTGSRYMAEQPPQYEKVDYLRSLDGNCGYCHNNPCVCDGFGNEPINPYNDSVDSIVDVPGYERPAYVQRERPPRH